MKKITILFLLAVNFIAAQTPWSTGNLVLNSYSAKFDVDPGNDIVTLTMIGPDDVWMGIAPGATKVANMGEIDDDVIVYTASGLQDRNMRGTRSRPAYDDSGNTIDEWTLVSDIVDGGTNVRTVIATRALDTGDPEDFSFPATPPGALLFLMAHGDVTNAAGGLAFNAHGIANKTSYVISDFVLGNDTEDFNYKTGLTFYPNPANDILNINVSDLYDNSLQIEVFDILGNSVINNNVNKFQSQLSIAGLNSGVYLLKLSSKTTKDFVVKRFIKI